MLTTRGALAVILLICVWSEEETKVQDTKKQIDSTEFENR